MKVALIIAVHGFLRKSELVEFVFDNVTISNELFMGKVNRKKGVESRKLSTFLVTDKLFLSKLNLYFNKFDGKVKWHVLHTLMYVI
jgi:hypothetical protein